ncbi:MAG: glutamine--fructose-6-phosphate transaminase (isomerizing) [Candidatus Bilamarchaeaceae archaeon]
MCGIIGYIGARPVGEILDEGLRRLEYRGYDSVGVAVLDDSGIKVHKDKGMIGVVSPALQFTALSGKAGIGHTRWATHGAPCKENAHPHFDCDKNVVLAHNGVIENYLELKKELLAKGHKFVSETDSEVIAHLIEELIKAGKKPETAFTSAVSKLRGSYAIVALINGSEQIYVARRNSPLILGVGEGGPVEMFCASDIPAMLRYTKKFVPLEDGDIAFISRNGFRIVGPNGKEVQRPIIEVDWDCKLAEKGGYPHFMLKEIHDQRHYLNESLSADASAAKALIAKSQVVDIIACGTSYHAGLVLAQLLREKGKNANAYIASEYPFIGNPDKSRLVVAISQSGETADTVQAVKFAKENGSKVLSLTNVVQSSITRLSDEVIYLNAGPEISVAATKTFTSQLAVVYKLALDRGAEMQLKTVPELVSQALSQERAIAKAAERFMKTQNAFFIGRYLGFPVAAEGALKLKEISYIHAESYPAGELKHGPLSLIEKGTPVIAIAPNDGSLQKMLGNIKEVKARGAYVIAVTDSPEAEEISDEAIPLPKMANEILFPFPAVVALQLLAYYVSTKKGIDPDKPRNLAKSVTVE